MSDFEKGFCILCGEIIKLNDKYPYCFKCGNSCSSFQKASSSVMPAYFCHKCGEGAYISDEKPICETCMKK